MMRTSLSGAGEGGDNKRKANALKKNVHFAEELEQVHEWYVVEDDATDEVDETLGPTSVSDARRTYEITILSSVHGNARRELREIPIFDLQSAIKYGTKSKGYPCRKTGATRWKYVYGNVVYITDETGTKEVTSYKEPITIQRATITQKLRERHHKEKETLKYDPFLCATHSVVVVDQSGSMRNSDVKGFRNRSMAAYGVLALEYIAEQLHGRGEDHGILDAVSIIEMNDTGSIIYDREPLDWILFNKLLDRQAEAKPKSHGSYSNALDVARNLILSELGAADEGMDPDDYPAYSMVFLSDGKPSDIEPHDTQQQLVILQNLTETLKHNFSFHAIGIGPSNADFRAMRHLAAAAQQNGSTGAFVFSELSCIKLGDAFSSIASSVTATRTEKLSANVIAGVPRKEKNVQLRSKYTPNSQRKFQRHLRSISRWRYNHDKYCRKYNWPWSMVDFRNSGVVGFDMERNPFGRGAERLAYMFYEIGSDNRRKGKALVAKETKYVDEDEDRKIRFHESFCRTQREANEFAKAFNKAIAMAPKLRPVEEGFKTPDIRFLDCFVYEYPSLDGKTCGVLVEDFLKGKFTKYNSNNGFEKKRTNHEGKIELGIGEVYMSDFLQAFSHWVYFHSDHKLLVCDLQGVLNEEGRHPKFELTDPCICSRKRGDRKKKKYGNTNLGLKSLKKFRSNHKCNGVCEGLGLPSF